MRTLRLFLLASAMAALVAAGRSGADVPTLFVPARPDSTSIESAPAPILMPGGPNPGDSLQRSREQVAIEQYQLGLSLEEQRAYAAAITAYRNAVRANPKLPQAHFRMGRLYASVGQHHAAALEFAAEIEHHPGDREAARLLGLALAQEGDSAHAIQQLERLVRLDPDDAASWRGLGFAYSLAERPADGERALRRALALEPANSATWRDLGALLAATHRDDDARTAYRKSADLDTNETGALINLGNLERRARRPKDAFAAYHEAELRDTTQVLAYRGQVQVLIEQKQQAAAGNVFRRWLRAKPDDTATRVEAIQLFQELERHDIALELARDGIRRDPRSGEARLAFGMALHSSGRVSEALPELRRAESWLSKPEQRTRVGALIRSLRASAPDSLRAVFAADSARFEAPADSTAR
ncbi:MAG: tetratricopeptide repeat protein [Candidatus Eisenbacteria bacterium]|nr:tetratricopeptide repeat protein [Candidatus Eisenbacteria bacterium]